MLRLSISDIGISEENLSDSNVSVDLNRTIVETASSSVSQLEGEYSGNEIDTLFFVTSLPYPVGRQSHLDFIRQVDWHPDNIFFLGSNCTSVLNAINFASLMLKNMQARKVAIIVADAFSQIIRSANCALTGELSEWRTMGSAMILTEESRYKYQIVGFETCTIPRFYDDVRINGSNHDAEFIFSNSNKNDFLNVDVPMEQKCIELAIGKSGWSKRSDISYVGTNRRQSRTDEIIEKMAFNPSQVFTSRQIIGHTGGSDIVYNLRTALLDGERTKKKFVVSSSGLGYQWSTMLLETLYFDVSR